MSDLSLYDRLRQVSECAPDAPAIAAPGRRPLSYEHLLAQCVATMNALNSFGIGRNDRVAVALENGPEMATAFLAISSGATCVPLNPNFRAEEFEFYLSRLNPKALMVNSGSSSAARGVAEAMRLPVLELQPTMEAAAGTFQLQGYGNPKTEFGGFAQADDVALVLHTSGTTSAPKMVPLTQRTLCEMTTNNRIFLELSNRDVCLNIMPLFHSTGLIVTLASLLAGGSVVCPPAFDAPRFFGWFPECRPTWYTAVPSMHQAILARVPGNESTIEQYPLRFVRSSSSALSRQLLNDLETKLKAPVIESYGLTETGMIACNPLPPATRKAGSVGRPTNIELAVIDEKGAVAPVGNIGEVVVRGNCVMEGYEGGAAANKDSFTDGWFRAGDQGLLDADGYLSNKDSFTDGWFRTGDLGFLDADGYLSLRGRLKEIINRGGEKISPGEVDALLLQHPDVEQAVTFPVPNEILGEEIAAAVVLRESASVSENELREFLAQRVAAFKVPRQILRVAELPKAAIGKVPRARLAELLAVKSRDQVASEVDLDFTSPETPDEVALSEIWSQVLDQARVGIHDDFFRLGGDSILATQVISQVQSLMGITLSPITLFEAPTVAKLARTLATARLNIDKADQPIKRISRS